MYIFSPENRQDVIVIFSCICVGIQPMLAQILQKIRHVSFHSCFRMVIKIADNTMQFERLFNLLGAKVETFRQT